MKKIVFLVFFILFIIPRVAGQVVVYSPNTYYLIPPKNGCDGEWAISIPFLCRSTYSLSACHSNSIDRFNGDTVFLKLCSIPCSFVYSGNTSYCLATCDYATSVENLSNPRNMSLYPNPGNGRVILNYTLRQDDVGEIKIYDLTGKLIQKDELNSNSNELQLTNLSNGIYLYQVFVNDRIVKSDKLVIIK